ncbi:uncharacterized protein [Danio rerio]|uniref:Uncharacterized protein n=1 Tax=Danio rerio TaxID=7955 RepID=A0AC58JDT0_DANRE
MADGCTATNTDMAGETRLVKDNGLAGGTRKAIDIGLGGETSTANDNGLAGGTSKANENGLDKRPRNGNKTEKSKFAERKYLKEATVIINVENVLEVKAEDVIKAIMEKCGQGKMLALRPRQGKEYELTMEKEEECEKLLEGLTINGVNCEVKSLHNRDYVVSFLHLPVYLENSIIVEKLEGWGVEPLTKIKRRCYPGTDIEDGTRFLKVRFPKEVASLPYSTRLETAEGPQHFRVMHSRQVKTCRQCMSPDHLLKDCPNFKCYRCGEWGHFARSCTTVRCSECAEFLDKCECWMEGKEGEKEKQVDRQVQEGNKEEDAKLEGDQEEEATQQREIEQLKNNTGEVVDFNEDGETKEGGNQMMEIEFSDMEENGQEKIEQNKDMDYEEDAKVDNMDKCMKVNLRRRTLKVKPNLDNVRKKAKANMFNVLRSLEGGEDE